MKTRILFGTLAGVASILAFASPSRADENAPAQSTTVTTQTTAEPSPQAVPQNQGIAPQASTTTTTSAETMRVNETAPPADTTTLYHETWPNKSLLIPGVALLGLTYGATAMTTWLGPGRGADDNLYIPVVGPWMNLADRQCNAGCGNEGLNKTLIIGSGVLQGAGALLTVAGLVIPEKTEAVRIQAGNVNVQLTPTVARGAAGFGAVGTF